MKKKDTNDTFDEMIKAGEAFKKALGISDNEIYDLLKDNDDIDWTDVTPVLEGEMPF